MLLRTFCFLALSGFFSHGENIPHSGLEFMQRLHRRCESKLKRAGESSGEGQTKLMAKGIGPYSTEVDPSRAVLSWNLPIVDAAISPKLRSMKLVLVSKDHEATPVKPIIALKSMMNGVETQFKSFYAPFKTHYLLENVKKLLKAIRNGQTQLQISIHLIQSSNSSAAILSDFIELSSKELQPFLLVRYDNCANGGKHGDLRNTRKRRREQRSSYSSSFIEKNYLYSNVTLQLLRQKRQLKANMCKLEALQVKTSQLGHSLSQRILLPSKITLNRCSGECNFSDSIDGDLEMTNHARFLHAFGKPGWKSCCVPTSFGPRTMLIVAHSEIAVVITHNLVAKSCGCR